MALARRPITYSDEGGAMFDLILQQIVVAETQVVTVDRATVTGLNTPDDIGRQEVTEEEDDDRGSLLLRGLRGLGIDVGDQLDGFNSLFTD